MKIKKYDKFDSHIDRIVCVKCGLVINDSEPGAPVPEFYHKANPKRYCPNEKKYLDVEMVGVSPFRRKRDRRARKRGAKLARKFTKKANSQ